jgi:hypothetical protein
MATGDRCKKLYHQMKKRLIAAIQKLGVKLQKTKAAQEHPKKVMRVGQDPMKEEIEPANNS